MNDVSATTKDAQEAADSQVAQPSAPIAGKIFRQPVPARLFAQAPINDLTARDMPRRATIDAFRANVADVLGLRIHCAGPLTQAQENLIGALIVASNGLDAALSMLPISPMEHQVLPNDIARSVVAILGAASAAVKAALSDDCPEGAVAILIDQSRYAIEDIGAHARAALSPSCDECGDGVMLPYTDRKIICDTCGVTRPRGRNFGGYRGCGGGR